MHVQARFLNLGQREHIDKHVGRRCVAKACDGRITNASLIIDLVQVQITLSRLLLAAEPLASSSRLRARRWLFQGSYYNWCCLLHGLLTVQRRLFYAQWDYIYVFGRNLRHFQAQWH